MVTSWSNHDGRMKIMSKNAGVYTALKSAVKLSLCLCERRADPQANPPAEILGR